MTKKDYELIAHSLGLSASRNDTVTVMNVAANLCKEFKHENSRFNADKFLERIGFWKYLYEKE